MRIESQEWQVPAEDAGATLAAAVKRRLEGAFSWRAAKALCAEGSARINGAVETDPARRLKAGDEIRITAETAGRPLGAARPSIVHFDADVVVVVKPAGILSVPYEREDRDTLLSRTAVELRRLEGRAGRRGSPALRVVQRLDKETSGVLVLARTVVAERHLQQQFRRHSVGRCYLALVNGRAEDATYDTVIVPDRGDGLRGSWGHFRRPRGNPPAEARQAITHVEVAERLSGATLVFCRLETGRQHQIRIHLAEAGHPLLGEQVYVRDSPGPLLSVERTMLHAEMLRFLHPRREEEMIFHQEPPADFAAALQRLRP